MDYLEACFAQGAGLIEAISLDTLERRVEDEFVVEVFDVVPRHRCKTWREGVLTG